MADVVESDRSLASWVQTSKPDPVNPQKGVDSRCVSPGGIDCLHVGFECNWGESWDSLRALFEAAREQATKHKGQEAGFLELGGAAVKVEASGAGRGYAHHRYKLNVEGLTITVGDRRNTNENKSPNVRIEVNGQNCAEEGAIECFNRGRRWLQAIGADLVANVVSQVHLCADIVGHDVADYRDKVYAGCFISRAREYGQHNEIKLTEFGTLEKSGPVIQTLGFGSRKRCYFRVYDKLEETRNDERRRQQLIKNRWGFEPEQAVRVEYELHRETLKELGVSDVDTLIASLPFLAQWCNENWLRMTEKRVKETKNTDRFATWETWQQVQAYFQAAFSGEVKRPEPVEPERSDKLLKQALGCMTSECARSGIVPITPIDVANYIKEYVVQHVDIFHKQCIEKMIDQGGWQRDRVDLIKQRINASRLEGLVPDQFDNRWYLWGHQPEEMASAVENDSKVHAGRLPGYEPASLPSLEIDFQNYEWGMNSDDF